MSKDCQQAWKLVEHFAYECRKTYAAHLICMILTGSLSRGSYQPGLSDVDLITVLKDNAADYVKAAISDLYNRIDQKYGIQFEPIILKYQDFFPPWDDDLCIQPELLRLKSSGKILWGKDIIGLLPTPTRKQIREFDISFREWFLSSDEPSWKNWTLESSIKSILGSATWYLYHKTEIIEFSKYHIADLLSKHFPDFPHLPSLRLASTLWRNYPNKVDEKFRFQMAKRAKELENCLILELGIGDKYLLK